MFSQTYVCLSTGRWESQVPVFPEGVVGISGTRFLLGEGGWVSLGGGYVQREGVSILLTWDTMAYSQQAGSMHPILFGFMDRPSEIESVRDKMILDTNQSVLPCLNLIH